MPAFQRDAFQLDPLAFQTGFMPTDIAGCKLWLDASLIAGNDGDAIGTWTDYSGNGFNATQATAGSKPTLKKPILSGKAIVRFDGGDFLDATPALSDRKPVTYVALVNPTNFSDPNGRAITGSYEHGLEWRLDTAGKQQALKENTASIGTATTAETAGRWTVLVLTYDATGNYAFYSNGVANGSGTNDQTFDAAAHLVVGANQISVAEFWLGDMAELIQYDTVLSAANRRTVEGYLWGKWLRPAPKPLVRSQAVHRASRW